MQGNVAHRSKMNGKVENNMDKKRRDRMLPKGEIDYQMTMQPGKK